MVRSDAVRQRNGLAKVGVRQRRNPHANVLQIRIIYDKQLRMPADVWLTARVLQQQYIISV